MSAPGVSQPNARIDAAERHELAAYYARQVAPFLDGGGP